MVQHVEKREEQGRLAGAGRALHQSEAMPLLMHHPGDLLRARARARGRGRARARGRGRGRGRDGVGVVVSMGASDLAERGQLRAGEAGRLP